jgi:hypothetical protein
MHAQTRHTQDTLDKLAEAETSLITRSSEAINAERHAAQLEAELGAACVPTTKPPYH